MAQLCDFPVGTKVTGRFPRDGKTYEAEVVRHENHRVVTKDAVGKERTAPPGLLTKR